MLWSERVSRCKQCLEVENSHHLVENLTRVSLCRRRRVSSSAQVRTPKGRLTESDGHLNLVSPSLGVLSGSALESDVDTVWTSRVEAVSSSLGELVHASGDVLVLVVVERLDLAAELADGVVEAPLDIVDGDNPRGALEESPLGGEL